MGKVTERIKLDNRLRLLIENGVKTNERSVICLVGEDGRNQVVHIHNLLSKATIKSRPSVLWCYKKELGFSTHRKKRIKLLQKRVKDGTMEVDQDEPFELFICATEIRWSYYKDTQKILGQTFDMLVLQDFEAITPNLLARTIETIAGGGLVIFLFKTIQSVKQLYTINMDVHARYRTEAHKYVKPRFNERFIISLKNNSNAIFMDNKWNILNISSGILNINPVTKPQVSQSNEELKTVKLQLSGTQPVGPVLNLTKTFDQANAFLKFVDIISEKKYKSTVALTASRGRGKSASLGLSIAVALAYGYSNIFVTSPSPENVATLFDFILKGLTALKYDQNQDYDVIQSDQADEKKCIVRININRERRQTVQYVTPNDAKVLAQAELLVIDEAAAIPLPIIKTLLGPYLIFMSSTINGYEGTGRSLSIKLMSSLRKDYVSEAENIGSRTLNEITLDESIRYSQDCPVEKWLNQLLCLDATVPRGTFTLPSPEHCSLYWVNRDTLFSGNKSSEEFLSQLMSLYVASHYKNQPNDLQLLSDAPAHHLFVLCPPITTAQQHLPFPLVVIQVALEGQISKESISAALRQGDKKSGDMIPWLISEQFRQYDFGELSGGRIIRIATHPDFQRAGYGKEALKQLEQYYKGNIPLKANLNNEDEKNITELNEETLLNEVIKPKEEMAMMSPLDQRKNERLDWIGVSFGLTHELLSFWNKAGYSPVYIRQTANATTGEHSSVFLKTLIPGTGYLETFNTDFRRRFVSLLSYDFAAFSPATALQVLGWKNTPINETVVLKAYFTAYDLERINLYAKGVVDYHLILDLIPQIVKMLFRGQIKVEGLSVQQKVILVSVGLQHRSVDDLSKINILPKLPVMPGSQILSHFKRALIKIQRVLREMEQARVSAELNISNKNAKGLKVDDDDIEDMDTVLEREGSKIAEKENVNKSVLEKELHLYKIKGDDSQWMQELDTKKNISNISIGRDRVVKVESEKRKGSDMKKNGANKFRKK